MKKYIETKDRLIDMRQEQSSNKSYEKIRNEAETVSYNKFQIFIRYNLHNSNLVALDPRTARRANFFFEPYTRMYA